MSSLKGKFSAESAWDVYDIVLTELNKLTEVQKTICAGSLRRNKQEVGDIDILICCATSKHGEIALTKLSQALGQGGGNGKSKRTYVINNIPADICVTTPSALPYAMMHHTGSMQENIRLRALAKKRGMQLSQHGLFYAGTNKLVVPDAKTEYDVYTALGSRYREPHER